MRILFLTHRLPHAPTSGDRIRAYYFLRAMREFASVSLFSLVHDAVEASRAGSIGGADVVVTARVPRLRNRVRGAASLLGHRPLTHALLDAPDAIAKLGELVRRCPPDLVFAYGSGMARFALAPPLAGLPFALDMVDVDSAKWAALADTTPGILGRVYRREARTLSAFEARAAEAAGITLVVNERERAALAALAPAARIDVMENGVDLDRFRPQGPPGESSTVTFSGVMSYEPNDAGARWFLQDVWPAVRAARPDARFVIVGAEPTSSLRAAAARTPGVDVVGAVPDMEPYLWRTAVSVAPLRIARGVQNKVLEALAAGVPAVVTPAVMSGLPFEAHAGCPSAGTAAEFASAVLAVLAMTPEARRGLAARARLDTVTWEKRTASLKLTLLKAIPATGKR